MALIHLVLRVGVGAAQSVATGYLPVQEDTIYFEVAGEGPALILMHDGLVHSVAWDRQFPALADSHRVVRFDRRGYGRSTSPTAPFSMIEDLQALQDHLGIRSAVLVAASAGGAMAVDFALANPERVNGLILVGAIVVGGSFSDHFLERGRRNSAPQEDGDTIRAYRNWLNDPYIMSPSSAETRQWLLSAAMPYAIKHLRNPQRFVRWHETNAVSRLADVTVPTLIVVGADDMPDVHAHAGILSAGIPGSRRVVIPEAGHLVFAEKPSQFNELVRGFLHQIAGQAFTREPMESGRAASEPRIN